MIKRLNLQDDFLVARLIEIQQKAYRIEAALIEFDGIPALTETADNLRAAQEIFDGYFVENNLAGVVSYALEGQTLDIGRLVVHPDYFRRGIASALLNHIEQVEPTASRIIVTTGARNTPACNLYLRHGYIQIETFTIADVLTMAKFEKLITKN